MIENGGSKKDLKITKGKIEFDKVSFGYDKKHPIISNFSLKIQPKQVVAIVGESGSGKSTIIDLLLKFYEPTSGHIYIDGQDISKKSVHSIRKNMSMVLQDAMLFDASVKGNIGYGQETFDLKKIESSAVTAHAQEFIQSMPQGYDTSVGKFGIKLSGGQKQRIAIARAVLRNASILVLDEATSSLDQSSERYVKEAILNLKNKYKAIIIITHRLDTIKSSDVIYVMKSGNLIEFGTHEHLLKKGGEYYRLYHKKILA